MNVGSSSQEVELNIAPVVDCFTVLITFMLVSASFLSIGILDAGIGAAGASVPNQAPPPEIVQVEMLPNFGLEVKLTGQVTQTIPLTAQAGNWDFDGLTRELTQFKTKWPQVDYVILNAANDTEYKNLISCMEKIRKVLPTVVLGGF